MQRFTTFSRDHSEFVSHLDGSFSRTHVAIPIRSLNVGTSAEEVTFEIKPVSSVQRPSNLRVAWTLARPETLVFSAGPMIAVISFCLARSLSVNFPLAISAFFGVLALHISLNLFNDVNDHLKGRDRLRPHGGSRVLQKGWARAYKVRFAAWSLVATAILFGLPALFYGPSLIVALVVALVGLEFVFQKLKLKARGWAEILAFLLTGPLLAAGYAWSITGAVSWSVLVMGAIFGAIALMYFHASNFENIMPDAQSGVRTWATRAGFEASKIFFHFTSILTLGTTVIFVTLIERETQLAPVIYAQGLFLIPVALRVGRLASPLSSGLMGLRSEAVKLSWITACAVSGGYLWIHSSALAERVVAVLAGELL